MRKTIFALALLCLVGGTVIAGPFFSRRTCATPSCQLAPTTSPIAITPSPEFKPEDQAVPQPWLLTSETVDTFSQAPDTALEPVQGTGSKLLTGPKLPERITHVLDDKQLEALKDALKSLPSSKQPVAIDLPMTAETSQRLSRISMLLEWLLWLGGGVFGVSSAGRVLPLVARLAAGLPSAMQAASQPSGTTQGAQSPAAPNK